MHKNFFHPNKKRINWLWHSCVKLVQYAKMSTISYNQIVFSGANFRWNCTRNVGKIYVHFYTTSSVRTWLWPHFSWWDSNVYLVANIFHFIVNYFILLWNSWCFVVFSEWLIVAYGIVQGVLAIFIAHWGYRTHMISWLTGLLMLQALAGVIAIIPTLTHSEG